MIRSTLSRREFILGSAASASLMASGGLTPRQAVAVERPIVDQQPWGRLEELALPVPSLETLEFLGQLLEADGDEQALRIMREVRSSYREQASELVLAYALRARKLGLPAPALAGIDLSGAEWSARTLLEAAAARYDAS